ncbi:uncharacterized protein [Branchiostoma lanceolatum]|uniref:uncharacterized protein n=1 Tax=Branchiostoma lanceolatum TaxID=7740 RepID=UPI0034548194
MMEKVTTPPQTDEGMMSSGFQGNRCDVSTGVEETLEHRAMLVNTHTDSLVSQESKERNCSTAYEQRQSMLQVSETLSSEKSFQKEELLASAITNSNTLLEVEIIKGIGDANLEKGKIAKNTAALADAVSFYRGALSRCEDPDGKEALLHRIRYAEKIKEKISTRRAKDASLGQTDTKTAQTRLSALAEEFRELDLIFDSGCDIGVVEGGYARMLIQAVSCQNEVLEREALKSLGDLYLKQSQTTDHNVVAFNKACGLYQEALRCCTSEEDKEVLQHRIRYAEKCTKLAHCQQATKPEVKTSANITLDVATTLQEVKEKIEMKAHGAMPLIEGYTDSFVKAVVDRDERLQTESLKVLEGTSKRERLARTRQHLQKQLGCTKVHWNGVKIQMVGKH